MGATTALDLRLLRALRSGPSHGYELARALAAEGGPDRATVYRRLASLRRRGLVEASRQPGKGRPRDVLRVSALGKAALQAELREALRLLFEAHHDRLRRGDGGGGAMRAPVVVVTGSRISGVEMRILGHIAEAMPRRVHLVVPPGLDPGRAAPGGVAVSEGSWAAMPFRDRFARTLLVNELPPRRGLARAAQEWRRVLGPGGALYVVAAAPLPEGADPFVDFLAALQRELFPDLRGAPAPGEVARALAAAFGKVAEHQEGNQRVWACRAPKEPARPSRRWG